MKTITLEMDFGTANAVREAIYQAQLGYSDEFAPIRIFNLREALLDLDDKIMEASK